MSKSTFFSGQPIFTQLLSFLDKSQIQRFSREAGSDHYCKKFSTYQHLVTMLYSSFQHCTSLREVTTGMRACEGRLQSCGLTHFPARSTLSDANKHRDYRVFEKIYLGLYHQTSHLLPDSRKNKRGNRLILMDTTTISLFKEILKGAGNKGLDGKRKGGIKVHTAAWAHEGVPFLAQFSSGATADVKAASDISFPEGSVVVFDKGFNDYQRFNRWSSEGVFWVTRLKQGSSFEVLRQAKVSMYQKIRGVISDQIIWLGNSAKKEKVRCRRVVFKDFKTGKVFEFISNHFKWKPASIADAYKQRWGIELLFKRIKQNMQLQYFLGDNENAIKIQIYCSLIADLLIKLVSAKVRKRWAFSNLASVIRLHLTNYTNLLKFLERPDQARIFNPISPAEQLMLNLSG